MFNEAKDDGSGGDNWSYMTCKALVKLSAPTPNFLQAGCPFCRPTNNVKALTEISHSMDLLTPSSPWVFQLCLWPLIAPGYLGGGLPCLSSALWCQYPKLHWEMILQTDASWRLPSPGVWHQVSEVLSKRCTYLDMCIVFCQFLLIRQRLSLDVAKTHHTSRLLLGYIYILRPL